MDLSTAWPAAARDRARARRRSCAWRMAEASARCPCREAITGGNAQAARAQERRPAQDGNWGRLLFPRPVLYWARRQEQGSRILREDSRVEYRIFYGAQGCGV